MSSDDEGGRYPMGSDDEGEAQRAVMLTMVVSACLYA